MLWVYQNGSSPLARGLPSLCESWGVGDRIIPARAGFTTRRILCPINARDHPRSRGVYSQRQEQGRPSAGSSPLARGLPRGLPLMRQDPRIIPARAGFTPHDYALTTTVPDHPRSRGVYPTTSGQMGGDVGSSPLARGLRHRPTHRRARGRIIPARAGFTPSTSAAPATPPGSSPLARGLRHRRSRPIRPRRIIPARAGFTPATRMFPETCWDHPRSRGVYLRLACAAIRFHGSSPLARGLLQWTRRKCLRRRIIPARAGFTLRAHLVKLHAQDHPRSRGVYDRKHAATNSQIGIIPARAGFTVRARRVGRVESDHPRSRGVYVEILGVIGCGHGSSPLARGLPGAPPRVR